MKQEELTKTFMMISNWKKNILATWSIQRKIILNIGIQANQKELTKTFMTISNWKNPILVLMVYTKKNHSQHGIQENQKELTKAFMTILNLKTLWSPRFSEKNLRLKG